ncbi:shikimate dehydrogenase [Leifsonia sp. C5G2]|jgi:shikimate dehydrogenase|uniref:shikimate dehydrogenase family protein n=1 Tax=Leifsonia sp. C5G2 TaxID=2735269 RepID=UPI001584F375|nr:shikimate dehydrogenase [Leifsonia sp. C5G2]NUU08458.1 shikimate dehydrogenase [Leifsonia sp. C5G2]
MITGHTRVIAVVGDPITAARAPQALNEALAAGGHDAVAIPAGIPAEALPAFIASARGWTNLAGLVVTMPHKGALASLVDELTPAARLSGAVNVVNRTPDGRLEGDQLDGSGFVGSLQAAAIEPAGSRILLLGAGGVARSIAFALAGSGPARLRMVNRSQAPVEELVAELRAAFPDRDIAAGTVGDAADSDLVVNATSVGSVVNPGIPIDPSLLAPDTVVADVVANPEHTELLAAAAGRGLRTHSGVRMQEAQFGRILDRLL